MTGNSERARVLVMGGTFNPVHCGHLRLVIETLETVDLDRVLWLPGYAPHYRDKGLLLPFDLRMDLLRVVSAGIESAAGVEVSDMERRQTGPAYSVDTIERLQVERPGSDFFFTLGLEQFSHLKSWRRGLELLNLASVVVAGREDLGADVFHRVVRESWPLARPVDPPPRALAAYRMENGREFILVAAPRLDVSSSLLRRRWLEGRSIRYLIPDAALDLLERNRDEVSAVWGGS